MSQNDFHMKFRDVVSISLLFAALEKSFPLFLTTTGDGSVNSGGKNPNEKVIRTLMDFSTGFPQNVVQQESR